MNLKKSTCHLKSSTLSRIKPCHPIALQDTDGGFLADDAMGSQNEGQLNPEAEAAAAKEVVAKAASGKSKFHDLFFVISHASLRNISPKQVVA